VVTTVYEPIEIVLEWAEKARRKRGEKSRVALKLNTSLQSINNAIVAARNGKKTKILRKLAAYLCSEELTENVIDSYLRPSFSPVSVESLALQIAEAAHVPYDLAVEYIRKNYPILTNIVDEGEFIFAEFYME
jgi:hypothetical protein